MTPPAAPAPDDYQAVINHFASGVTIITTRVDGVDYGATASAVSAVSSDPAMLLICLRSDSSTAAQVQQADAFVLNILTEDQVGLAGRFATKAPDKFAGVATTALPGGAALDGALAHIDCTVERVHPAATHLVIVARVHSARSFAGRPLTYYRSTFGRLETDPDAAALQVVRDHVLTAVAAEDDSLDPVELARALGLEQGLVQHALRALASESIVRRDGSRFTILPVPDELLFDYYTAKLTIELGVAEQTVGAVSAESLAQLRALMEATGGYLGDGRFRDAEGYIAANNAFHDFMIGLAGSATVTSAYRALGMRGIERRTITDGTYTSGEILDDHRAIVEGYEAGDLAAVREALRRHAARPREMRATAELPR